jgi:hypothetical protein
MRLFSLTCETLLFLAMFIFRRAIFSRYPYGNYLHLPKFLFFRGRIAIFGMHIFSKSIFGRCRGQCQGSGVQRWSCFQVLLWIKNIRFEFKVEQIVGASHCNTWQLYLDTLKHS